jgi:hypothetical protein
MRNIQLGSNPTNSNSSSTNVTAFWLVENDSKQRSRSISTLFDGSACNFTACSLWYLHGKYSLILRKLVFSDIIYYQIFKFMNLKIHCADNLSKNFILTSFLTTTNWKIVRIWSQRLSEYYPDHLHLKCLNIAEFSHFWTISYIHEMNVHGISI